MGSSPYGGREFNALHIEIMVFNNWVMRKKVLEEYSMGKGKPLLDIVKISFIIISYVSYNIMCIWA